MKRSEAYKKNKIPKSNSKRSYLQKEIPNSKVQVESKNLKRRKKSKIEVRVEEPKMKKTKVRDEESTKRRKNQPKRKKNPN